MYNVYIKSKNKEKGSKMTYKIKNIVFSDLSVAEVRENETVYFATMTYKRTRKEECIVVIDNNNQVIAWNT